MISRRAKPRALRMALIGVAGVLAILGLVPGEPAVLVDAAHAIIGRPAMLYAL